VPRHTAASHACRSRSRGIGNGTRGAGPRSRRAIRDNGFTDEPRSGAHSIRSRRSEPSRAGGGRQAPIQAEPLALDDVAQWRMDAFEASIPESLVNLTQQIAAPCAEVADYRHRFERLRRELSRRRITELVDEIDATLARIKARNLQEHGSVSGDDEWPVLREASKQLRRLVGDTASAGDWSTLFRHLSFGEAVDLRDIVERDWPSVRAAVEAGMYADGEPLPVAVEDLGSLVAQQPSGPVSTALAWDALDSEGFERLVFNLLRDAPGYHNAQWLMATNAPDRGRDLSVERDVPDSLGTGRRERVIVQCKHWRTRSIRPTDAVEAVTQAQTRLARRASRTPRAAPERRRQPRRLRAATAQKRWRGERDAWGASFHSCNPHGLRS
jgi:hypothetical protein